MKQEILKKDYRIQIDTKTGKWIGLFDRYLPKENWIAETHTGGFCIPFVHGTQFGEDYLDCPFIETKNGLRAQTQSGATHLEITAEEEMIQIDFTTPIDNGPRIGLQMNFNLLDLPSRTSWKHQCMPKIIYVDETGQYAYFVFGTADSRYLILTVSTPLAAWRIQYSYEGHRMIGFQLLTQADDIRTDGRGELPVVSSIALQIQFTDYLSACLPKIASTLKNSICVSQITGGMMGARIPYTILGEYHKGYVKAPSGNMTEFHQTEGEIFLKEHGIYEVIVYAKSGQQHITRLLCHENWEQQFDRVNRFYQKYFQHVSGACYRAISTDTKKPDQDCIGGCSFGDPFSHYSCRTGEFGGFAAWAMLKNELIFGKKPELHQSVEQYLCHWALNRGHEDTPYFGTLYKKPHSFLGRDYGAYHVYEEYNFMQHEIFLLEEMADYYRFCQDSMVLEDALHLIDHIIQEHMRADGAVINQNFPDEPGVDYSTVHLPICAFLRWAEILKAHMPKQSNKCLQIAEKIADHVCTRGLDFPTEGEPCTEDGSMGCSAATLLYAYLKVMPKPAYLAKAKEILSAHHVLEMDGTDCRMKNTTIRFWETQYETRDWGPSINAGHAWTIWTAEAKVALALIEKEFALLQQAYEGFLTNICTVSPSGGIYCCYTPDMIPGTPHAYFLDCQTDKMLEYNDLRPTSSHLGMTYPPKAFTTSGNYYLIKAAEFWSRISGLDLNTGTAINGVFDGNCFQSAAVHFDCLLLHGNREDSIQIVCKPYTSIDILRKEGELCVIGAECIRQEKGKWTVSCADTPFEIQVIL